MFFIRSHFTWKYIPPILWISQKKVYGQILIISTNNYMCLNPFWLPKEILCNIWRLKLREKCPYSELFWSNFSCHRTESGQIISLRFQSEYVQMRTRITPNKDTFLRSVKQSNGSERNTLFTWKRCFRSKGFCRK